MTHRTMSRHSTTELHLTLLQTKDIALCFMLENKVTPSCIFITDGSDSDSGTI